MTLHVPAGYDSTRPYPLIVVLHGFSAYGYVQLLYLGFDKLVEEQDVLVVAPDGTANPDGNRFWNATDACCDFYGSEVDDAAYLTGLVRDISAEYHVDAKRKYLAGHSNGGFMSYRLACDHADVFAGIVSLAGSTFDDVVRCSPSEPVSVLQVHGTDDDTVPYEGFQEGTLLKRAYPGAKDAVEHWRTYNGCSGEVVAQAAPINLVNALDGEETGRLRATGCPGEVGVELWTIEEGSHVPILNGEFAHRVWEWMSAHPKP